MASISVDGKDYEMVTRESLTIGDLRVVKRYTGAAGEALNDLDDSDPDMTAALIHIAFLRENPALSYAAIERMVDAVKVVSLDFTPDEEEEEAEGEADPTTPEPDSSTSEEQPSSGDDSSENGEPSQASVTQLDSGLRVSATGSGFVQETSAS